MIPNIAVFLFVLIGAYVMLAIGWLAVLFTGKWPEGMRNFVIGAIRWTMRANAYSNLMTDAYPPFSLQA